MLGDDGSCRQPAIRFRSRYRQFYGPGPGKVVLRIAGVPGDLVYAFDG